MILSSKPPRTGVTCLVVRFVLACEISRLLGVRRARVIFFYSRQKCNPFTKREGDLPGLTRAPLIRRGQARNRWGEECDGLVANGEAIPAVLGVLEFVDEGDRVVLEGNTAVAPCVDNQVVFAHAEFTCALARLKKSGRAEVGPIDAALFQVL